LARGKTVIEGDQTDSIKEYWKKPANKVAFFTLLAVLAYTGISLMLLYVGRDTEIGQTRAYVSLRDIRFERRNDDGFDIVPQWENTGSSETIGILAYISRYLSDTELPQGFTNGDFPGSTPVPITLGPKAISNVTYSSIAKTCLSQFNRRDDLRKFYIWGWAKYGDTLTSDQHVTRFCWDIDQVVFSPDGEVGRISHNLCSEGNCTEKDCIAPTEKLAIAVRQNTCKDAPLTKPVPLPPKKK
jgi:hypothetical protein